MDIATLIGIIVGAVMVVFGILWGNGVSTLQNFVDVPSIIITIGGSLSGLITSYTLKDFLGSFKGVVLHLKIQSMITELRYLRLLNYLTLQEKKDFLLLKRLLRI